MFCLDNQSEKMNNWHILLLFFAFLGVIFLKKKNNFSCCAHRAHTMAATLHSRKKLSRVIMASHPVFLLLSDKKNIGKAETALPTET
jgi:hypothetical protein